MVIVHAVCCTLVTLATGKQRQEYCYKFEPGLVIYQPGFYSEILSQKKKN